MNGRIVVADDVTVAFTELLVSSFVERTSKQFSVAFSGGDTAKRCYEKVASTAKNAIDWSCVTALWGDERCVPLDDPDSNYRLVREALLDHVGPFGCVEPMRCDAGADYYNDLVASLPPIDFVHLGLGPDGHTASLFPGSEALTAPRDRFVVANNDPFAHNPHERLTFTYAGIARARRVVVTVAGETKAAALLRVQQGDMTAPAALLQADDLIWIVDQAALANRGRR